MKSIEKEVEQVTKMVMDLASELEAEPYLVPVGISARHVHLTLEAVSILFGKDHALTVMKALSQPGQYAANEQVQVIGPAGSFSKVRILGPVRAACQVEVSASDARILGVNPPVRASGKIAGTPGVRLMGPEGELELKEGVMIAERHIHMSPEDAAWFGVLNGDMVKIKVSGPKAGTMEQVSVRVDSNYRLDLHIDTDDANAFLLRQGEKVRLEKAL
ncbi:MAG: hypothetical protein PWP24_1186 [Clostridiales bacterium]|nr:hypothetical protein [Clostridiales bacterium]